MIHRRPHRQRTLDAIIDTYRRTDRCQIHWAPGTGKTLLGRWLAEDLNASTVVVFVPSLALIAQTLAEWQRVPGWDFTPLVVCSDRTTVDSWRVDAGRWVAAQRRAYAVGALPSDRIALLSGVPGWTWTAEESWWAADHAYVAELAAARGGIDVNDPEIATARLPHRMRSALTVGRWCARQRRAAREDTLAGWQIRACESIPGWTWDGGVPERDARMVDAWAEWVEGRRDANVPHHARWGRLPLGVFVTTVRRRAVVGTLLPALADDIAVIVPPKHLPGAFEWRSADTRWELHWMALQQYARRTGGCDIPEHGTEEFYGRQWPIYAWATRQRHLHRHGKLDPKRAELLEQIPGWSWERITTKRVRGRDRCAAARQPPRLRGRLPVRAVHGGEHRLRGVSTAATGPTLAAIESLVRRGWPKAWISRELGGNGKALQVGRSGSPVVSRKSADAVAGLVRRIGDRVPPRRGRRMLPPLDEIITSEQRSVVGA